MKINQISGILFFLFSCAFFNVPAQDIELRQLFNAQDSARMANPATFLRRAEENLQLALKEKNTPQVIKLLIERMACQIEISRDSFPSQIKKIETIAQNSSQPEEKAILNSLLAELYLNFYSQDSYTYNSRENLIAVPDNIAEWSGNLFIEKINKLLIQSLLPQKILQQTSMSKFESIINIGTDSPELRPTLFDFLSYRAINMYNNYTYKQNFPTQTQVSGKQLMAPFSNFITYKFTGKAGEPRTRILTIYQDLLRFRDKNPMSPAFIIANLDRLSYANQWSTDKTLYPQILKKQINFYKDSPWSIEIAVQLLSYIQQRQDSSLNATLPSILSICKNLLSTYPDFEKSKCLNDIIANIECPFIAIKVPDFIYPDNKNYLHLSYKNIDNIRTQIYRIPAITQLKTEKEISTFCISNHLIYNNIIQLSDTITPIQKNDSCLIPISTPGQYIIKISTINDSSYSACAIVHMTRLMTAYSRIQNNETIFVTDAKSGKPIKKASILLYNSATYNDLKYINSYETDKNGIVTFSTSEETRYRVVYKNDTCPISSYTSYPYSFDEPNNYNLTLFTDRSLYRPGQKVQFSGIYYISGKNKQGVIPSQKLKLNLSNRGKIISSTEVTSDDFGSFSGEFTLPENLLLGQFQINCSSDKARTSTSFEVADYKRPTFHIDFKKSHDILNFGQIVNIRGIVTRYSGINLPNAKVEYRIIRLANWFGQGRASQAQIAEGTSITDSDGKFTIRFVPQKPEEDALSIGVSYNYQINVIVTSPTGETQEGQTILSIGDTPIIISLSMPQIIDKTQSIPLDIQITNTQKNDIDLPCKYILYALYPSKKVQDFYELEKNKIRIQVEEKSFTSKHIPDSVNWNQLPSGAYRLVIQTTDTQGKIISNETNFILYSPKDKALPVNVTVWLPKEEYNVKPGNTIKVPYGTAFKNAYVLYQLYEGEKILETKQLKISNQSKGLNITYKTSYKENLLLSLIFIKNGKIYDRQIIIKKEKPNPILQITTSTFRDKLSPGAKEEWTFTIKDQAGNPVSARFISEMFDASLDAIMPHNWHFNPVHTFQPYINWQKGYYKYQQTFTSRYQPIIKCNAFQYDLLKVPFSILYLNEYSNVSFLTKSSAFTGRLYGLKIRGGGLDEAVSIADAAGNIITRPELAKIPDNKLNINQIQSSYRQNFNETAFFYPHLQTNENGEVTVRFTVPEANTQWKFLALAFTKQLQYKLEQKTTISSKSLMVAPNVPRFVRQGDNANIATLISNTGDSILEGTIHFEIFDPYTNISEQQTSQIFILRPGESKTVIYPFTAPEDNDLMGFRVKAVTPKLSDGEQHWLPILPTKTLVTEAKNFNIGEGKIEKTVEMNNFINNRSNTLQNYRMTLEYTANPIWYAIQALPSLSEITNENATQIFASYYANTMAAGIAAMNPQITSAINIWKANNKNSNSLRSNLEKNAELKSILLSETPWVLDAQTETEQIQNLVQLFDKNRIPYLQNEALKKLRNLQSNEGGWSWFKQMQPSQFITLNILYGMSQLTESGMVQFDAPTKEMQIKALSYVDKKIIDNTFAKTTDRLSYNQIVYLFVRSYYRDIPLSGKTLDIHKDMMNRMLKQWPGFSLYEKALAAVAMYRYGFDNEAQQIITSLREYATITSQSGMFWQNNRSTYSYRNSAIQVHTAIMNAFTEITQDTVALDKMKTWLLQQKQTQNWGNIPSTVDAIYALVRTGSNWTKNLNATQIKWGEKWLPENENNKITGYMQYSRQGQEINKSLGSITIKSNNKQPSIGAIYWQYFDDFKNIKNSSTPGLSIEKQLFVEKITPEGSEYVPLNTTLLHTGDKISIRLVVKVNRDLEFVCLSDQRAACFEPVEQLSQYKCNEQVCYYQETKDASTNLFFDYLPKGTYVFNYNVRADRPGIYNNGISTIQCLYAPQMVANTAGGMITVK